MKGNQCISFITKIGLLFFFIQFLDYKAKICPECGVETLDDEITLQANSIPLSNSILQNNPYKIQNQNSQAQTSSPSTTSQNYKDDDDIG
ncbi:unnamed protein product, partial [marine sediment metagenome]